MAEKKYQTTISPISIDLGASNTGVLCTHGTLSENGFQANKNKGVCLTFNKDKLQFLQKERTAKRHQTRTIERRKLAKRLFLCILESKQINTNTYKKAINFCNGLLNRRGFTFTTESPTFFSEIEVSKIFLKHLKPNEDDKTLSDYFSGIEKLGLDERKLKIQNILETLKNEKKSIETDLKNTSDEKANNKWQKVKEYTEKIEEGIDGGAQHREVYFNNIKQDIKKCLDNKLDEKHQHANNYNLGKNLEALLSELQMKEEEFFNVLGNISNLQLRVLRKYFNNNKNNTWDNDKLYTLIRRWIVSWHCKDKEETDKKRQIDLLKKFNAHKKNKEEKTNVINLFKNISPSDTIPPYEDQNNRNIPKCATLYLNPTGLDKEYSEWETVTKLLLENLNDANSNMKYDCFKNVSIKLARFNNKHVDINNNKIERQKNARILQRILDTNKYLDPYSIRAHAYKYLENKKQLTPKYRTHLEKTYQNLRNVFKQDKTRLTFLTFAHTYYEEIERAKVGIWNEPTTLKEANNNLFYKCNHNTPRKDKLPHEYINNLLGSQLTKVSLGKFKTEFWNNNASKISGYQTYKGFAQKVEELRKERGNAFSNQMKFIAKNLQDKNAAEIKLTEKMMELKTFLEKLQDNKDFYTKLLKAVGIEQQKQEYYNLYKQIEHLYIIAQIYTILENDISGYAKDCKFCTREKSWRMQKVERPEVKDKEVTNKEVARATTLFKDSVRPFDGYLARYLDRIATEIAREKIEQLKNLNVNNDKIYVPIFIEQNKFEFEPTLAENKNSLTKTKKAEEWKEKKDNKDEYVKTQLADKETRIKQDSKDLCPYCGNSLPKTSNGDIDHIYPRAKSLKKYNTIFNSEANLIFVCSPCNKTKGGNLYLLNNLNKKYLQKQFDTDDINTIESDINTSIESIKKHYINFNISLSSKEQTYMRHALFIEDLRDDILNLINTRTKTMVNGTQAYLSKLITKKLRNENNNIFCYPFQMPVTDDNYIAYTVIKKADDEDKKHKNMQQIDPTPHYKEILSASKCVSATRTLLALNNPKYIKEGDQADSSHIIDASMVWGTVLRDQKILHKTLLKNKFREDSNKTNFEDTIFNIASIYNNIENLSKLENLIPIKNLQTKFLERKKVLDGKNLWNKSVFKDTIYGEKFEPLILKNDGSLYHGYIPYGYKTANKECITPLLNKEKNSKELFELLKPYILLHNRSLTHSYDKYLNYMKEKKWEYLYFSINKQKVFEFYQQTFYNPVFPNLNENTKIIIENLESMRFVYLKSEKEAKAGNNYFKFLKESDYYKNYLNAKNSLIEQEVLKQKNIYKSIIQFIDDKNIEDNKENNLANITQEDWDFLKAKKQLILSKSFFKNKNTLKSKDAINEIIKNINPKEKTLIQKIDKMLAQEQMKNICVNRIHKKKPTKKNLISTNQPSGTLLRIQRKDLHPDKAIFQTVVGGDNQKSFLITKGKYNNKQVLLKELCIHKNIVPCNILEWVPYKDNLDIKKEATNSDPREIDLQHKKIEKAIYNPKNKKPEQHKMTLYFTKENYEEFENLVQKIKDKQNIHTQNFSKYLKNDNDNNIISLEKKENETDTEKKIREKNTVSLTIKQDMKDITVEFQLKSKDIRKCFHL